LGYGLGWAEGSTSSIVFARWEGTLLLQIQRVVGRNCCNNITFWLMLLSNLHSVIHKCQIGVVPTTCYSLTDAQCLNATCVHRRSVATSFFLVDGYAYSRSFCGFFGVVTANILHRGIKMILILFLTLLGEYFWASVLNDSLEWKFGSLNFGSLQFLSTNISQRNVAMRLRCGGIFDYCFSSNLLLSLSLK